MATLNLTSENFDKTIESNDIVLLDFWAEWCGPCKAFGPVFEKVSNDNPDIVFGKIDTEAQRELAGAFGIRSIPTLAVFRGQIPVFMQPGMVPENVLSDLISQVRALDMEEVKAAYEEQVANAKPS